MHVVKHLEAAALEYLKKVINKVVGDLRARRTVQYFDCAGVSQEHTASMIRKATTRVIAVRTEICYNYFDLAIPTISNDMQLP
jgi:hypothetical protein